MRHPQQIRVSKRRGPHRCKMAPRPPIHKARRLHNKKNPHALAQLSPFPLPLFPRGHIYVKAHTRSMQQPTRFNSSTRAKTPTETHNAARHFDSENTMSVLPSSQLRQRWRRSGWGMYLCPGRVMGYGETKGPSSVLHHFAAAAEVQVDIQSPRAKPPIACTSRRYRVQSSHVSKTFPEIPDPKGKHTPGESRPERKACFH
jgi:hypothetical protein